MHIINIVLFGVGTNYQTIADVQIMVHDLKIILIFNSYKLKGEKYLYK